MTVYETEVPGVGKKFELDVGDGERLVVLIHHDGKREVYRRPDTDADSEKLFAVSAEQARQLGSIIEGAYFEPVQLDQVQVPLGDAIIEWVDVAEGSPLAGTTLADAAIRGQTGVSVIAVQRGSETISNPTADFEIAAGDILVTIGTREELQSLSELLTTADGDSDEDGGGDETADEDSPADGDA